MTPQKSKAVMEFEAARDAAADDDFNNSRDPHKDDTDLAYLSFIAGATWAATNSPVVKMLEEALKSLDTATVTKEANIREDLKPWQKQIVYETLNQLAEIRQACGALPHVQGKTEIPHGRGK